MLGAEIRYVKTAQQHFFSMNIKKKNPENLSLAIFKLQKCQTFKKQNKTKQTHTCKDLSLALKYWAPKAKNYLFTVHPNWTALSDKAQYCPSKAEPVITVGWPKNCSTVFKGCFLYSFRKIWVLSQIFIPSCTSFSKLQWN